MCVFERGGGGGTNQYKDQFTIKITCLVTTAYFNVQEMVPLKCCRQIFVFAAEMQGAHNEPFSSRKTSLCSLKKLEGNCFG